MAVQLYLRRIFFLLSLAILLTTGCAGAGTTSSQSGQTTPPTPTATITSPTTVPPSIAPSPGTTSCDESLWNHVYNPQRLHRIEDCKTVTGTVAAIKKEADGDYHIRLTLDSLFSNMINQKNIDGQHGDLVLEPVCQNKITQADAVDACNGFTYQVYIPKVGEHVKVLGDYVLDSEHGWNELHPVYSIENISDELSF